MEPLRGSTEVVHLAHNQDVEGSSPSPAICSDPALSPSPAGAVASRPNAAAPVQPRPQALVLVEPTGERSPDATVPELLEILGAIQLDDLVMISAAAIVAGERGYGNFCRGCGIEVSLRHLPTCQLGEPGEDVSDAECVDVEELVRAAVVTMRGIR